MSKQLSDMTLEELWLLFPIFLTEHKPCWAEWYNEEKDKLKQILPSDIEFYHIGSTAINGIMAKPIIDIIIAANNVAEIKQIANILQRCGYINMATSQTRISLNKGYTSNGFSERVFHLHIRLKDDIDEVNFRDYMNAHPAAAKEYEQLKLRLWKIYEHNRDAYTEAKTDFIVYHTRLAKQSV